MEGVVNEKPRRDHTGNNLLRSVIVMYVTSDMPIFIKHFEKSIIHKVPNEKMALFHNVILRIPMIPCNVCLLRLSNK